MGYKLGIAAVMLLICVLLAPTAAADLGQQRKDFVAARDALRKGQVSRFKKLRARLQDYVLVGYLDYEHLRRRLHRRPTQAVREFFRSYPDSPLTERLRATWLRTLARQQRWSTFLEDYRGLSSTTLKCHHARALWETGQTEAAFQEVEALWLVGRSQPRACDPVFDTWRASGRASSDLIWARVRLAMENRRLSLARYLGRFLNKEDRKWVERWRRMYRRPAAMLDDPRYREDTAVVRTIVSHGIARLARLDAEEARKKWRSVKSRYAFSAETIGRTERRIALVAAYQRRPQAHQWLTQVGPDHADERVQEWRIRTALADENWLAVLQWIDALPSAAQQEDRWRYWRARALMNLGRKSIAEQLFTELAGTHYYHGFLAADQMSLPYALDGKRVPHTEEELEAVASLPAIVRAHELYVLGMTVDARREWNYAIRSLDERRLQLAAVLAHQWGWHDRAILTLGRTDHLSDLDLRFPIVFQRQVTANARAQNIEPAWVFGVLRQESAFMTDARSRAGALGLMQLMPRTARSVARSLRLPLQSNWDLLNVDKNIKLGTAHLRRVLDINQGHHVLATASYNAGVQRVKSWLPKQASLPADLWVETVPFTETRRYVQKVLGTTAIFEKRLGERIIPLARRMKEVGPSS